MSRSPLTVDIDLRSPVPELGSVGAGLGERVLVDLIAEEERLAHLAVSDELRKGEAHLLSAIESEIDLRWKIFLGDHDFVG